MTYLYIFGLIVWIVFVMTMSGWWVSFWMKRKHGNTLLMIFELVMIATIYLCSIMFPLVILVDQRMIT